MPHNSAMIRKREGQTLNAMSPERPKRPPADRIRWLDEEIAELMLLLPGWQVMELEREASSRDLTLGQLIRGLITDHLTHQRNSDTANWSPPDAPREGEDRTSL
jgi:hypothetical protein